MSVLDEIIVGVKADLANRKIQHPLHQIRSRALESAPALDVTEYFADGAFGVIAEVKRSSPSKGALAQISDPAALAKSYERGGACAISVLTEERRFNGSLADLAAVRGAVSIPVLRKEFIVDEYQIFEARAYGADIILLIVAALSDEQLVEFSNLTHSLGMRTLIEIHDENELLRVIRLSAQGVLALDLLGINARNLKTLDINSGLFSQMAPLVAAGVPLIAESGISSANEVAALAAVGADGILVGEALVKDGDPAESIRTFLHRAEAARVRRLSP
jgi:indole-3-glycerol phosphate synthase